MCCWAERFSFLSLGSSPTSYSLKFLSSPFTEYMSGFKEANERNEGLVKAHVPGKYKSPSQAYESLRSSRLGVRENLRSLWPRADQIGPLRLCCLSGMVPRRPARPRGRKGLAWGLSVNPFIFTFLWDKTFHFQCWVAPFSSPRTPCLHDNQFRKLLQCKLKDEWLWHLLIL